MGWERLWTALRDRMRSIASAPSRRRVLVRLTLRTLVYTTVRAQAAIALVLQFNASTGISMAGGAAAGVVATLAVILVVLTVRAEGTPAGPGPSGAEGH